MLSRRPAPLLEGVLHLLKGCRKTVLKRSKIVDWHLLGSLHSGTQVCKHVITLQATISSSDTETELSNVICFLPPLQIKSEFIVTQAILHQYIAELEPGRGKVFPRSGTDIITQIRVTRRGGEVGCFYTLIALLDNCPCMCPFRLTSIDVSMGL